MAETYQGIGKRHDSQCDGSDGLPSTTDGSWYQRLWHPVKCGLVAVAMAASFVWIICTLMVVGR
jgi:hypothetical protein